LHCPHQHSEEVGASLESEEQGQAIVPSPNLAELLNLVQRAVEQVVGVGALPRLTKSIEVKDTGSKSPLTGGNSSSYVALPNMVVWSTSH
jgi:hypothetical protein